MRILEQVKTLDWVQVFTDLLSNFPKRSPWFSPAYEGTENMFYFFKYGAIFTLNRIVVEVFTFSLKVLTFASNIENQDTIGSSYDEEAAVFFLELLIRVVLQNR